MGNKFIAKRIAALSVAGALMLSMPMVEEVTGISAISVTASAASTRSTYTQNDLERLISTHDAFVKKYGKNAYLSYVSSEKVMKAYVKEVQRASNYLASYFNVSDETIEDGYYGPDCKKLVKMIQGKLHCQKDGYCGNATYSAMVSQLRDILNSQNVNQSSETLVPSEEIYINQYGYFRDRGTSKACTLSSCGMLMRSYAYQNGIEPSTITEKELWEKGWTSSGCRGSFTVKGITVKTQGIATSKQCYNDPDKTAQYIKRVISSHKEGIVLYCWKNNTKAEHAVYLSADTSNGWTILDPANGKAEYIPMKESENWISQNIANVSQIWYIGELND